MTITAPETTRTVNPFAPPLDHAARRRSLIHAARIRYRHPDWAVIVVALIAFEAGAPAVSVAERRGWLDEFGDLVDRWQLLADVADTDSARRALEELGEGPWTDEVLAEALALRGDLNGEIDRLVQEAQ